jgi:hypothetical protein
MKMKISSINRFFNILFGALAMLMVALVSAFIAMRLAIHGREVKVPNLTGLTLAEAGHLTSSLGLSLNLENRFYSPTTPPDHVLAQFPAPGSTVRREWPVRVTESLGPQEVSIPNVLGQSERTASINIRRLALDLGVVARIPSPGPGGVILAQTPSPNATGVDRPRVSLLLSEVPPDTRPTSSATSSVARTDPQDSSQEPAQDLPPDVIESPESPQAVVMPSLAGLTLAGASARCAAAGLRIVSAESLNAPLAPPATPTTPTPTPTQPAAQPAASTATPISLGTVVAQSPPSGHRVVKGDPVHITLTN